jgi:hypothetical protein
MNFPVPPLEPRLQRRFVQLVKEHLHSAPPLAAGPAALPRLTTAFASTQAAWRFFANDTVTLPDLIQPLQAAGRLALATSPADYALLVHDWSILNYHRHASKPDQILFSKGSDRGYELASTLLVDAAHGDPLAPLELHLRSATAVHSTRVPAPRASLHHLDGVLPAMRAAAALALPRPLVHVIDCEGDSVAHLRRWHKHRQLFLVRTDGTRTVRWRGRDAKLPEVVATLEQEQAFGTPRSVRYHGSSATQTVAEAAVILTRPAYQNRHGRRRVIRGKPLSLRLVVSQVRAADGTLLAQWCLLTNVPADVEADRIALWYYWRWRIESFYKLLKGAGQQVESWPQESAAALAKRLVVASMACVVVWQVARREGAEGERWRQLLVRLSGRQMKWGVPFTLPALLAGLWVLLAMTEVLAHYDLDEIQRIAATLLPQLPQPNSSQATCVDTNGCQPLETVTVLPKSAPEGRQNPGVGTHWYLHKCWKAPDVVFLPATADYIWACGDLCRYQWVGTPGYRLPPLRG